MGGNGPSSPLAFLASCASRTVRSNQSRALIGMWSIRHSAVGNRRHVEFRMLSVAARRIRPLIGGASVQCLTYSTLLLLAGLRMDLTWTSTLGLALALTGTDDRTRLYPPRTGGGAGAITLAGLRLAAAAAALAMAARWAVVYRTGGGLATMAWSVTR